MGFELSLFSESKSSIVGGATGSLTEYKALQSDSESMGLPNKSLSIEFTGFKSISG